MSSSWPGTSCDAKIGGGVDVEHEHRDNPAGDRLPEPARRALVSVLMNRYVSRTRQTTLIHERIELAQDEQAAIDGRRAAMTVRLQAFGQVLPSSSGDLELLRAALAELRAGLVVQLEQLSEEYEAQVGERARLGTAITELKAELEQVLKQAGNIPYDADQRRRLIAEGARIPVERLQYIGELLDIPPEYRGWERAILTIIRPLASDLLVPAEDFPAVRAWVNSHNLGGDITLVPGVARRPVHAHQAGTVAAMLEITAAPTKGGSAGNWSGSPTCAWRRTPTLKAPESTVWWAG